MTADLLSNYRTRIVANAPINHGTQLSRIFWRITARLVVVTQQITRPPDL